MRSAIDVAMLILALIVVTCAHTSSATQGRCSRQVTRARYVCDTHRESYTSYYAGWCPFRRIYYRRQRTSYRTGQNCRRQNYVATEYYCCNGYTQRGENCIDIDECSLGQHDCHHNATCINLNTSYNCTCKPGYRDNGDASNPGRSCSDIDECTEEISQCVYGSCENTDGGYICNCRKRGDVYLYTGQYCDQPTGNVVE